MTTKDGEEPEWSPESDQQLYYSVRSRTVQNVITWTYPHVLSSYANMAILQNAILFEVGEGASVSHIDDSNGDHILDNTGDPLIAVGGSIRDAFAYTRIEAASIRSEVAETYVDVGAWIYTQPLTERYPIHTRTLITTALILSRMARQRQRLERSRDLLIGMMNHLIQPQSLRYLLKE